MPQIHLSIFSLFLRSIASSLSMFYQYPSPLAWCPLPGSQCRLKPHHIFPRAHSRLLKNIGETEVCWLKERRQCCICHWQGKEKAGQEQTCCSWCCLRRKKVVKTVDGDCCWKELPAPISPQALSPSQGFLSPEKHFTKRSVGNVWLPFPFK